MAFAVVMMLAEDGPFDQRPEPFDGMDKAP